MPWRVSRLIVVWQEWLPLRQFIHDWAWGHRTSVIGSMIFGSPKTQYHQFIQVRK
jgi:hypothetical protein